LPTGGNDGDGSADGSSSGEGGSPLDGLLADQDSVDGTTAVDSPAGDSMQALDVPLTSDGSLEDAADTSVVSCYASAPFTPIPWAPPSAFPQSACTAVQVSAYLACYPNCSAFRSDTTNAACLACIETDVAATTHGPVITSGGQPVEINSGGCEAHYDGDTAAGSCGYQYNNAKDCFYAECNTCTDYANPQPGGPADQCEAAAFAAGGQCSSDNVTPTCVSETGDGGVAATCGALGTFLPAWCGGKCTPVSVTPPPSHGGAACQQGPSPTCWPHDVSRFTSSWVPPLGAHLGQCTATQISGFYFACLAPGSTTAGCDAWQTNAANTTCLGCLYTGSSAAAYGVLIGYSLGSLVFVEVNQAGCIALAEPCNLPCAQAMQAETECSNAACSSYCATLSSYDTCATESDSCGCSGYATSAACQTQITGTQHPAESTCDLNGVSFQAIYNATATFMCGP
jgi:hypothetical protein